MNSQSRQRRHEVEHETRSEREARDLKGKLKESTGIIIGDSAIEAEGKSQKLAGKAQEKLGQIEKVLGK